MGSEYMARHHARLMHGVQDALAQLYRLLIAPLEEMLKSRRLLIIPYGSLHMLPFHALWTGSGYWLEQTEITYTPSASVAVHKRRDASAAQHSRFAGFAPFDQRIPQAQAEIEMAATYFTEAQRYHDDAATVANLRHAAATADVLHLATHGLFRPDNSFFSAIKLADGWMDVREIYRLKLAAQLVVLSACESGAGEVRAGDEVVGLARGFLAAGAQNLIATLWNVHDSSAAHLMNCFYSVLHDFAPSGLAQSAFMEDTSNQRDMSRWQPAAALRAAQLAALRRGEHPYYWAPFYAIG
jgi:CHAT domain-containing protein